MYQIAEQGKATPLMKDNVWLAGGTKPMLVLQAVEDAIASSEDAGEPLATEFPDRVKLVIVEEAGHALLPEQPEAISTAVPAFLSRLD
jgi:pimeloyl-ACP methyl ester carboxylesterase